MQILITGSSGLIGSEAVRYFDAKGYDVVGIDNNMRKEFFGSQGDTSWNLELLNKETKRFRHIELDIRDRESVDSLLETTGLDLIIHCAAQPSHDKAAEIALIDFDVNAVGTINLLEATRRHRPNAVFVFMSTNKVYGDAPNQIEMKELDTRWDYADLNYENGIPESFSIDQCLHSVFGASKVAADIMVQEYGRYFGMKTVAFRGGCLTGPRHSGVELHGFLSYLVKTVVQEGDYKIFGYKGKQVRDNIHCEDVIKAIECFAESPRTGEVYNLGGGRDNSISMLEAIARIEELSCTKLNSEILEQPRKGDHICYYSDLTKMKSHYPEWDITRSLDEMLIEMVEVEKSRH